jgi:hypothetical protein
VRLLDRAVLDVELDRRDMDAADRKIDGVPEIVAVALALERSTRTISRPPSATPITRNWR